MKTKLLLIVVLCLLGFESWGQNPYFHKVKANKSEGIIALLKRYKLYDEPCNVAKFYELNALKSNAHLVADRLYKLPIYIYTYNGKSIRTTIKDQNLAKAKRIQSYNEYLVRNKLRKTQYTKSNILWVPYSDLKCSENSFIKKQAQPKVKSSPGQLNVPLFGSKHKLVKRIDNSLKGKVYYLVSGHGGPDPGAMCTKGCIADLCEDEYAYDVVLRMARNLMARGAVVYVIIKDPNDGIRDSKILKADKDEVCYPNRKIPLNQLDRLKQRTDAMNELYVKHKRKGAKEQLAIVVHVDSRGRKTEQDVFFYHHEGSVTGKKYATKMHKTFKKKYDLYQKNRGYEGYVKPRGLFVVRNTYAPLVYVELANIRNKHDQKRILQPNNRQALADWMCESFTGINFE